MKTYTLEIDGEPIVAFRALDDAHAQSIVDGAGTNDDLTMELLAVDRKDGSRLWNGKAIPTFRPASPQEHQRYIQRASKFAIESPLLDVVYLVPCFLFLSLEDDAEAA